MLRAGGTLVIATWCQREEPPAFTARERAALQFLYDEWAHPFFVSVQEYGRLLEVRRSLLPRPHAHMTCGGQARHAAQHCYAWRSAKAVLAGFVIACNLCCMQ